MAEGRSRRSGQKTDDPATPQRAVEEEENRTGGVGLIHRWLAHAKHKHNILPFPVALNTLPVWGHGSRETHLPLVDLFPWWSVGEGRVDWGGELELY